MNIILLALLVGIFIIVFNYSSVEHFYDFLTSMIEFTRLDGSLIKRIKIGSSTSMYDSEVTNLFRQDDVIRINIPENYSVRIIYKFKNQSKGFGQTVNLVAGSYDIYRLIENKEIYQIDISHNFGLSTNYNDLLVRDWDGNIIYTGSRLVPIDWDLIYSNYGYDDYYIYYPREKLIRTNYYWNYPRHKFYRPSDRINTYRTRDRIHSYRPNRDHGRVDSGNVFQGKGQFVTTDGVPLTRGKGQWILPTGQNPR